MPLVDDQGIAVTLGIAKETYQSILRLNIYDPVLALGKGGVTLRRMRMHHVLARQAEQNITHCQHSLVELLDLVVKIRRLAGGRINDRFGIPPAVIPAMRPPVAEIPQPFGAIGQVGELLPPDVTLAWPPVFAMFGRQRKCPERNVVFQGQRARWPDYQNAASFCHCRRQESHSCHS